MFMFCPLLDNEVLVSRFNKWLFCRQCFCTSGAVTKKKAHAHSVAPWQRMKYLFAFVGLAEMQPVEIPIRMSRVSAIKHN